MSAPELVAPGIRRLLAPNPGLMTGPGTNTYLLGSGRAVVVDPGPADDAHLEAILAAVAGRVEAVWLTHAHPDHATGVAPLVAATGARLAAWPAPNPTFAIPGLAAPDAALGDGDVLCADGEAYVALHTPGHASDHVCFFRPADRVLLTGDVIVGKGTVVVAPPDGDLAAYMKTLDRLEALGPSRLLPGHGDPVANAAAKIGDYRQHRLAREAQVVAALAPGKVAPHAIVDALYAAIPSGLRGMAAKQVEGHLLKLEAEGRATCREGRWSLRRGDGET